MLASERKTVCGSGASLSAPRKLGQLDDPARRLLLAASHCPARLPNFAQAICHARLPTRTCCFPSVDDIRGQPQGDEFARVS